MADFITLILTACGAISWIIAMAGVASIDAISGVKQSTTALAWWAVWSQFFLLIFGAIVAIGNLSCVRLRTHMLLMVSVVWMIVAWENNVDLDFSTMDKSRVRAALAGSILVLIFNMLQIIYYGLTEDGTQPLQCGRRPKPDAGAAPSTAPPAGLDSPKQSVTSQAPPASPAPASEV